jgi:hypothetical protein
MKRDALATGGAHVLVLTGVAVLAWGALARPGGSLRAAEGHAGASAHLAAPAPYAAESLGAAAAGRDLFRADRRATEVAYDAARSTMPPAPAPVRPVLILSGIVWGPVPEAVLEGLPGTDGPRVVRTGDVVARLTVRRIEPAEVVIVGMDTTWTLKVREPWR